MRRLVLFTLIVGVAACRPAPGPSYLYLWAGDSAHTASDFLAVIDATPGSPKYGTVVASLPTGEHGTHPHHTEATMPASGHLLANGFHAGRSYLFDLTRPTRPRLLKAFGDLAGLSHPHTYWRLDDGTLLTTFQYSEFENHHTLMPDGSHQMTSATPASMEMGAEHATGGLVHMDEQGNVIWEGRAWDTTIADRRIYPYSALPLPAMDRIVSTTTDMDDMDTAATSQWIQVWRLNDLRLLRTFALAPGPRGNENRWSGEPRLLPDGRSVYIHTFMCGLYLLKNPDSITATSPVPHATLVHTFEGKFCGVPVQTGHWWIATVPQAHALVVLDITDPEHPRQAAQLDLGAAEEPHWLSIDSAGRRLAVNSSGGGTGNRLYVVNFDPATGALAMDSTFRDAGDSLPGLKLTGRSWPHGWTGHAIPHGTVFSH